MIRSFHGYWLTLCLLGVAVLTIAAYLPCWLGLLKGYCE